MAIDGGDLITIADAKDKGGRWIGDTLQALLDEVIEGVVPNEKEALAARAAELLKDVQ